MHLSKIVPLTFLSVAVLGCGRADPEAIVIMPLGDSITWGSPGLDETPGGYRTELHRQLTEAGLKIRFIGSQKANPSAPLNKARQRRHEGHNGYSIADISINLDSNDGIRDSNGGHWLSGSRWRAPLSPHIILLHIGTNDLVLRNYVTLPELAERLNGLVEKIFLLAPDTHLFVSNLIPFNHPPYFAVQEFYNSVIANEIVPKFARQGKKITFVDQRSNFMDETGKIVAARLPDNVHPDQTGYDLMGGTWARAILSNFAPAPLPTAARS